MESSDIFEKKIYHKFQRCPYCNSYSINKVKNQELNLISKFDHFKCSNCTKTFNHDSNTKSDLKKSKTTRFISFIKDTVPYVFGLVILICIVYFITVLKSDYSVSDSTKTDNSVSTIPKIIKKPVISKVIEEAIPEDPNQDSNTNTIEQQPITEIVYQFITLGKFKIFGVNWTATSKGLDISRVNRGPFRNAGLQKGDIIFSVNGIKIKEEKQLLDVRDLIISNQVEEAVIVVFRLDKTIHYKIKK